MNVGKLETDGWSHPHSIKFETHFSPIFLAVNAPLNTLVKPLTTLIENLSNHTCMVSYPIPMLYASL